jgi:primosomal protein N' (replication factor Y)
MSSNGRVMAVGGGRRATDLFGEAAPEEPRGRQARLAQVLTPVALDQSYTYRVPPGLEVGPGSVVRVPLGPRQVIGVVTAEEPSLAAGSNRLREIAAVFPAPPLKPSLLAFVDWVSRYTLTPRGMVMRMTIRAPEALEPEPPVRAVVRDGPAPERLTDARRRVLAVLDEREGMAWSRSGLSGAAGVSASVVDGLLEAGTLREVLLPAGPPVRPPEPDFGRKARRRPWWRASTARRRSPCWRGSRARARPTSTWKPWPSACAAVARHWCWFRRSP